MVIILDDFTGYTKSQYTIINSNPTKGGFSNR